MNLQRKTLRTALVALLVTAVDAFVTPKAFVTGRTVGCLGEPLQMLPTDPLAVSLLVSDDASAALGPLRTFFFAITALVLFAAGLTYATVAFIVPAAAEQLEKDTRRLRPGLWEDYEAKLLEGEIMAARPDLLQEIGDVMQPIILADFDESAKAKDEGAGASKKKKK